MRQAKWILTLAALLAAAAARAQSSETTELRGGRCRFVSIDAETNEEQVKKCPGLGGYRAYTRASHTSVYLGFQPPGAPAPLEVIHGYSLGDRIDWRGAREGGGLRPFAAIVRVIVKDPETLTAGGQVLAVTRFDAGKACVAALIDAGAHRDANEMARRAADWSAEHFHCAGRSPAIVGAETKWTKILLEQLAEHGEGL